MFPRFNPLLWLRFLLEGDDSLELFSSIMYLLFFGLFLLFYFFPNKQFLPHFFDVELFLATSSSVFEFEVVSVAVAEKTDVLSAWR